MEGPHTQRENRHFPPRITALFPPANRTLLGETVPSKSHGRRSLVGCCLWGRTESDTTEAT